MKKSLEGPLIHVGKRQDREGNSEYLLLRQVDERQYAWFVDLKGDERPCKLQASSIGEALRLAYSLWKEEAFHPIHCGFRYYMEPRDEHGNNALFCEMIASYSSNSASRDYFDKRCGQRCYVDFASEEALSLWQQLRDEERL